MLTLTFDLTECATCKKTEIEGNALKPLKPCAKCKRQWYCSRECQKSDWKNHKKTCGRTRAQPTSTHDVTPSTNNQNDITPSVNNQNYIIPTTNSHIDSEGICCIPNPYTALQNGTWLKNRPKKDVYKLLVDTYRMRLADQHASKGDVSEGSLNSGASVESTIQHFLHFLTNVIKLDATRNKKLLPGWWTENSCKECTKFAQNDEFSNIGLAIDEDDIEEHYGQMDMPMQLRIFSEKIDGYVARGTTYESKLTIQAEFEKGNSRRIHPAL